MGRKSIILRPTSMLRKQAGQLRKLFNLWPDNKPSKNKIQPKTNSEILVSEGKPMFLTRTKGLDTTFITRRQIVLNRHFTEILSDVLANNLKKELYELGVTLTSIETKAWNKGVDIYYSRKDLLDKKIHLELRSLIPQLRSAIAERRLIGRVPPINFVYDSTINLNRDLDKVLDSANIPKLASEKDITEYPHQRLQRFRTTKTEDDVDGLKSKKFSSPDDMDNTTLGLNYPSLYNEVVSKLERGRAQSSRMITNVTVAPIEPMITVPFQLQTERNDPVARVTKMQSFLINQKKKTEVTARLKRKRELFDRDRYKWDVPSDIDINNL